MNLESNICRFLLDLKEVSQSSIATSLHESRAAGQLKVDDETFRLVVQLVESKLQSSFDAGVTQVSLILKD